MIDRTGLAQFLRHRRASLQPEDVGLSRRERRRTRGLRREEVAHVCHMSTDYYARIERERGPRPSPQIIASIAHGLHLSLDERDHLYRLAGHHPPTRVTSSNHIAPGLLRVLDHLTDAPAEIVNELGETLRQNSLGIALTGDTTGYAGPARSRGYRWFTDPATRQFHVAEDHAFLSRMYTAELRRVAALRGPGSWAAHLVGLLLTECEEFQRRWNDHEIDVHPRDVGRFVHPDVGLLELSRQLLLDPNHSHGLLVYTATTGSESHGKLQRLSAPGAPASP